MKPFIIAAKRLKSGNKLTKDALKLSREKDKILSKDNK